jgi:uncharacterized membrane protein YczE
MIAAPLLGKWPGNSLASTGLNAGMAWNRLPRRLTQLYIGLLLYGFAAAVQVRAGLGLDPWDVFHQGLAHHTGLAIGTISIIVGALVLLAWIPLRQLPGLGTLSNVVLIGVSLNVSLQLLPTVGDLVERVLMLALAIVLGGVATGLYIGANFGPGPRDGLMTGLARRSGKSIRLVRTCIEVSVLAAGWLLGGTVGIGTVAYALAIGPLAQIFLRMFATDRTTGAMMSHARAEHETSRHGRRWPRARGHRVRDWPLDHAEPNLVD